MKFIRYFKDVMRFNQLPAEQKQICFYCEGENYWPHLKPIIEGLLGQPNVVVNYVSSDANDPGLLIEDARYNTFVIGEGYIRNYFFENLNCGLMVMTMPDLDQYQVKKSKQVNQFVYVHHSLVSHHMVYRPKAFDAFDVMLCAGPHHKKEMLLMQEKTPMTPKILIDHGYGRLDSIIANREDRTNNHRKTILVAPSWGENGTIETMGEALIDALLGMPYHVILRPHPQTLKLAEKTLAAIAKKHRDNPRFQLEIGVASEASLFASDLMISDWSGAAMDYAFGLLKPVLFIDVPRKVQNPKYVELPIEPFEVMVREQIGAVQKADLVGLQEQIEGLLDGQQNWHQRLTKARDQHVFNVGNSGQAATAALLELL